MEDMKLVWIAYAILISALIVGGVLIPIFREISDHRKRKQ